MFIKELESLTIVFVLLSIISYINENEYIVNLNLYIKKIVILFRDHEKIKNLDNFFIVHLDRCKSLFVVPNFVKQKLHLKNCISAFSNYVSLCTNRTSKVYHNF